MSLQKALKRKKLLAEKDDLTKEGLFYDGVGAKKTQLEIWADPNLSKNTHSILVQLYVLAPALCEVSELSHGRADTGDSLRIA